MKWLVITLIMLLSAPQLAFAGKGIGETATYAREQGYEERYSYVASGNGAGQVEYQGWAGANTATSAAKWRIRRFTYDSSNRITAIEWAGGDDKYNQSWDSRATASY